MDKKIAQEIIKENDLKCSADEFIEYFKSQEVDVEKIKKSYEVEIRTFDKGHKGKKINNPAKGKYYYILKAGAREYLQYHYPYVEGLVGLDDDNINESIELQKTRMAQEEAEFIKLQNTIKHFK